MKAILLTLLLACATAFPQTPEKPTTNSPTNKVLLLTCRPSSSRRGLARIRHQRRPEHMADARRGCRSSSRRRMDRTLS